MDFNALVVTPAAAVGIATINETQTDRRLEPVTCPDGRAVLPAAVRDDDMWHDYSAILATLVREIIVIPDSEE